MRTNAGVGSWLSIRYYFAYRGVLVLSVLLLQITCGVDLTDEIQYYGEIKGLVATGRLFSTDLFIQQTVYILVYPILLAQHAVFGDAGLILCGRLILAVAIAMVYIKIYKTVEGINSYRMAASAAAFGITFAITYHGIFAPSYNTISQVLWIAFALNFMVWQGCSLVFLGGLVLATIFAHPTSAMAMFMLVVVRLVYEKKFSALLKFLRGVVVGGALILGVLVCFASPGDYLRSLSFSSGYGVGTVFFSSSTGPANLGIIYLLFIVAAFSGKLVNRFKQPLLLVAIVLLVGRNLVHPLPGGYDGYSASAALQLAELSALAYAAALSRVSQSSGVLTQGHVHWFAGLLLVYATTLGITSGNGIGQSTGAFMVGLPLLMAVACLQADKGMHRGVAVLAMVGMVLIAVWSFGHWCRYPYREAHWWQSTQTMQDIPEFRFISTSAERARLLAQVKNTLQPDTLNKKVLVVSEYPGIYFASGGAIETCMVYMHSLTSDQSEIVLKDCLKSKRPDVVVDVFTDTESAYQGSRIKAVMRQFYGDAYPECKSSVLELGSQSWVNPGRLVIKICKPRGTRLISG